MLAWGFPCNIHSQHTEKWEDRIGWRRSLVTTINTTTTTYHHHHSTANVQSLLPKISKLNALIHGKLWCHCTQWDLARHPKQASACRSFNTWLQSFHVDKPTPSGRGGGSILYVKNTLNPIERKSSATCTKEIIQVDINPKNAVHLKLY